jgi:multidrug efflux pump subunit AcrA (membrane-fusion protein)
MSDAQPPIIEEIDDEELALLAALKAVKEKKARILEEAEERRKAEEKRKADEAAEAKRKAEEVAETQRKAEEAERKRKAKEAETKRLADVAEAERVEKARQVKEAEEAERIRAANEAMQVGVASHLAEQKRVADATAAANAAAALATRQRNLAKAGVRPDDPLMLVPEGPGPSRREVQEIRRQVAEQGKKRKLGDTEASVRFSRSLRRRVS